MINIKENEKLNTIKPQLCSFTSTSSKTPYIQRQNFGLDQ